MLRWLLTTLALLALTASEPPLDALVRGKWVRFFDTGHGADTATMCIPSRTPAALATEVAVLPERVTGLQAAGATAVVLDLDVALLQPMADDGRLDALASGGSLILPAGLAGVDSPQVRYGLRVQTRTPVGRMVLGLPADTDVPPLALQGLAIHQGAAPPQRTPTGWMVGGTVIATDGPLLQFMPYLIPFIHWTDRSTWPQAEGRVVSVGACRVDRDLTRYGRQPSTVAHGEWIETALAGQRPAKAPWLLDLGLSLLALGLAALGARLRGWIAAAATGMGVLALSLVLSLFGVWAALTPIALAAALGGALAPRAPSSPG